jgi:circadian clock protein KaiC
VPSGWGGSSARRGPYHPVMDADRMATGISGAPRVSTGVPGLDEVLAGGLPSRRVHLVQGAPGAGKTTLALQFLLHGAARGERCLYISLSETREEVETVAESHGWKLGDVVVFEASRMGPEDENTLFDPSEVELGERMDAILTEVERVKPSRLVLDSCTELRLLAHTPVRYRRQILALKRHLAEANRTVLLLDNPAPNAPDVLLQSLAHSVIMLEQLHPDFGAERRRLRVTKMRGVAYRGGNHDYVIRTGGLVVFPRIVPAEHRARRVAESFSSGLAALDALVGGALDRGTSTLLIGPAGSGKSSLATIFAHAAAARDERAAVFLFDEARETLLARSRAIGMDLAPHLAADRLTIQQVDPAELSPGEFIHEVRAAVDERNSRVVVIDSANGLFQAMPDERFVLLQLHDLLMYLGQKGVLTLLVMAQHGMIGDLSGPADVSYLADTVILVRFFESHGAVRKAISVVKKRTGRHETTIREYEIGAGGIRIGEPLASFQGILTGVPTQEHDPERPRPTGPR